MAKQEKTKPVPTLKITPVGETIPEGEQLKEQFYELLLPEEYQELRQYLGNDGFLSNEEISAALRDARLEKEELGAKLAALNLPSENPLQQEKMADYLWELHQIVADPTLEKVRLNQNYQVETLQALPDAARKPGEEEQKQTGKKTDSGIDIVNGGLIANFLHNFKKTYNLNENPAVEMEKKTRYQWQDVEASLEKMGLSRQMLAESGNLERLLKGEKTGVIDFKSTYNDQETALRGKIYLVKQGQEVKPYFQTVKQSLQLPESYLGHKFSEQDKELLKQTGELGKRVELDDQYTKKKFDAYIGVDKETNSLTVWRADRVHVPMQIKGVDVSKEQQETLRQGGSIRLTGMISENGQKFDADIQVSAGKRSLSFSPPSEAIKQAVDVKTAKELGRTADQLQGTSAGGATTKDKSPTQKQTKTQAKNKGIDPGRSAGAVDSPDLALQTSPGSNPKQAQSKSQAKNKNAQKDQGLSM